MSSVIMVDAMNTRSLVPIRVLRLATPPECVQTLVCRNGPILPEIMPAYSAQAYIWPLLSYWKNITIIPMYPGGMDMQIVIPRSPGGYG